MMDNKLLQVVNLLRLVIYVFIYSVGNFLPNGLVPPPLGVRNVKIRENSEKIRKPPGSFRDPLQRFLGP